MCSVGRLLNLNFPGLRRRHGFFNGACARDHQRNAPVTPRQTGDLAVTSSRHMILRRRAYVCFPRCQIFFNIFSRCVPSSHDFEAVHRRITGVTVTGHNSTAHTHVGSTAVAKVITPFTTKTRTVRRCNLVRPFRGLCSYYYESSCLNRTPGFSEQKSYNSDSDPRYMAAACACLRRQCFH